MTDATRVTSEYDLIFRPSIKLKNGKRLFAWQYGLKAFALRIRKDKKKK